MESTTYLFWVCINVLFIKNFAIIKFINKRRYVASGSSDNSVAIFDSENGKCLKRIKKAHSDWVKAIEF